MGGEWERTNERRVATKTPRRGGGIIAGEIDFEVEEALMRSRITTADTPIVEKTAVGIDRET